MLLEKSDGNYAELSEEQKADEIMNIRNGLNFAKKVLCTGGCDLLILDEVLRLAFRFLKTEQLDLRLHPAQEFRIIFARNRFTGRRRWEGKLPICCWQSTGPMASRIIYRVSADGINLFLYRTDCL